MAKYAALPPVVDKINAICLYFLKWCIGNTTAVMWSKAANEAVTRNHGVRFDWLFWPKQTAAVRTAA